MTIRQALLPLLLVAEFAWLLWCSEIPLDNFGLFLRVLWGNLEAVLIHAAPLLVLALGMTLVLITAGIDLSVGSMTALIACVMSTFPGGETFWLTAVPVGLLLAVGLGAFNGPLISRMDIPPIIATLGTLFFYRGLCYVVLSEGRTSSVFNQIPAWGLLPNYQWLGEFPGAVLIAGVVLLLVGGWVSWSRWRREILMLGGNRIAARYAGIPSDLRLFQVYAFMGVCAFLAAIIGTAREGAVSANWQEGLELQVIVAVVLGGTRVDGGFGSIPGSIIGVLLVVVLDEGLRMIGQSELQPVMLGLLLILGVKLNTGLLAISVFDSSKKRAS
jgi:ribose/xylose/arabinose/galactoside ABC-type transport system permease subunit